MTVTSLETRSPISLPHVRKRQLAWFTRYVAWYLRRNFHGLHLLQLTSLESLDGLPLVVCLNHPSWWDPLIGLYLSERFFPERYHAAPIGADGLAKYKFFERLGFFGIPSERGQRAFRFMAVGKAVLSRTDGALWVTPQGAFTDVRQPIRLEPGIGYLATQLQSFALLPVALEYGFWNERFPEAFVCFGFPVIANGHTATAAEWSVRFTRSLQDTADCLSAKVQLRDTRLFDSLLQGKAGVGGMYDVWRASVAKLHGKRWQPEHGGK